MKDVIPRFKVGDTVQVINYGSSIWISKELPVSFPLLKRGNKVNWYDIQPQLVGKRGVVRNVSVIQGVPRYSINSIPGKTAWYTEGQLKQIL